MRIPRAFRPLHAGRTAASAWLERGYTLAEKDYSTWTRPEHKAGTTGLARYFDYGTGPVPEMADDSTYYTDVIRWLVAHPRPQAVRRRSFLVKGAEHPDAAEAARLKQTSCDVRASVVCMRAWAAGYRLTRDFYLGDRAMRESGFDPSFRFGPFSGATHHYAPVCLNSLLYRYERDMQHLALLLGKPNDAHALGSPCQGAQRRHPSISVASAARRLRGLRLHPHKSSRLCLYLIALSIVGGRGHARRGRQDGCQTQSLRTARRAYP